MNMFLGFLVLLFVAANVVHSEERFDEELLIKDLGGGHSGFHFNFVSRTPEYDQPAQHHNIIPKPVFDLLAKYSVDEFHLSIVRGYWDNERWGQGFVKAAPSGAELWAWFRPDTPNVERSWFELTHALSGQFCASLDRLATKTHFAIPKWSYRPTGITKFDDTANSTELVRYAQMAGEGLCSENITPWVKMLPCKSHKGIASLLIPTSLFRSNYDALKISLRRICWDNSCSMLGFELSQTLTVVFDRRLLYGDLKAPWSIEGFFGTSIRGACNAARTSQVVVLNSSQKLDISGGVPTLLNSTITDDRVMTVFPSSNLNTEAVDRLLFSSAPNVHSPAASLPLISVSKYVTGSGTFNGGIRTLITSRSDIELPVVYLDLIPWYTQVLFSTLEVHLQDGLSREWKKTVPIKSHLVPSVSRGRMGLIELVLRIPAGYQVAVSYKFRRVLQRWDEYPPDANRGYFLPAASISYQIPKGELARIQNNTHSAFREITLPNWASTYAEYFDKRHNDVPYRPGDGFVRIHSSVVLISMPTPDFSMPFNTLCIVCSVIALLFGSVHKITAGKLEAKPAGEGGPLLVRLIRKLVNRLRSIRIWRKPSAVPPTDSDLKKNE